jgi:diketogulonate reductase-like aldo/keto reductase
MTDQISKIKLNNGMTMPALGLGVFQTAPEGTASAVQSALEIGYRHIDTAAAYFNEREVGEGIRRSGIARSELFIETKAWINDYGFDATRHAFEKSAGKLGVETIDLFILHQPFPSQFDLTLDAYRGLESLLAEGRVRAIGVSNFMLDHLQVLLEETSVVPAVNQIEVHPYFRQTAIQDANAKHGIVSQAWSPIGGITFYPGWGENHESTLENPTIRDIAEAHGKTPAQVMLRWHLEQGRSAIPKSTNPKRLAENFAIFDFALSDGERAAIDALDTGRRAGPDPESITLEKYGAEIPEA